MASAHAVPFERCPRVPSRTLAVLFIVSLGGIAPAGCGGGDRGAQRTGTPGTESATATDTTREGRTFVATYEDGPVDRLRVVRDTAGGIVVEGVTGFPDGTAIVISLLRPNPAGRTETVAATRAIVDLGRFQGQPLFAAGGPLPPGPVSIRVHASFAPGRQSEAILQATAGGRRFRGAGMRETREGHSVYESTVEASL